MYATTSGNEPQELEISSKFRTVNNARNVVSWTPDPKVASSASEYTHYFGTSLSQIMETDAIRFTVFEDGVFSKTLIGSAIIRIGSLLKVDADTKHFSNTLSFSQVPLVHDSDSKTNGEISGTMTLKGVPRFVQMYAGRNLDGVVYGGSPYPGAPMLPARVSNDPVMSVSSP